MNPERSIFYAVTIPSLVVELLFFYHKTESLKKALLYTLLTAKLYVIMAMLFGLDTVAFFIIFYRKVGDAIIVTSRIPVSFGILTLTMLILSVITLYTYNKILGMIPSNNIREILEVVEA